jgi:hypothetical protein
MSASDRDEYQRSHEAFLRRRGRRTLFAVFSEDWPCDVCHEWIRAGDGVAMTGAGVEHATCPARWSPTVIDGGRTDPQHQPQLRFLAAAPDPTQGEP